jgi:Cu-processing system permease protein
MRSASAAVVRDLQPTTAYEPPSVGSILTIARKEIRDALRNKWFLLYTIAFAALALGLSSLALAGTGQYGFGGFGRTAASLINLVMLIVPLMALTAGAGSLANERERGTLDYLLAQPISRLEVLLGKYLGLALALLASLCLGFGICAAVIGARSGGADALPFLRLVMLAYALALCMLSLGMLISAFARRGGLALAATVFAWLALVFLGDLGLMGSTLAFKLNVTQMLSLAMLSPLQVFKMASLSSIHASLDVLGPAGLYATQHWGDRLPWLFAGVLAAWVILPLALAQMVLKRGVA